MFVLSVKGALLVPDLALGCHTLTGEALELVLLHEMAHIRSAAGGLSPTRLLARCGRP
jgi:beta-lactamase regulating signal transducer with metallopeptidase domain